MALSEQTKARWEQKKRELAAAAPAEAAPRNDSIQQKWEQKKRELAMQRQQAAPAAAKPAVKPSIAGASRAVTDTGTGGGMPRRALPATPAAGRLTEEAFDRSPVLQERYGSYQRYAAQNKRYYARPELGGDTDRLRGDYSTYETAARDALRAYEKAEEKQKTTEGTLENLKQSLPALQQSFQRDPSALNNALYQTVLQRYESLAAQYAQEAEDAQRLYGDYEQSLGKYQDALRTYRDYLTGEQERYQDWRSTIRTDENAIGRDLTAANAKVEQLQARKEQLQRQAKQLMDKAYPRNSGTDALLLQAQALQEQAREVDSRIAKARSAADLLQEELDWKKYYQYADLMEAEDFAEKSRYVSTETGEAPKLGWSGVYRDTGFGDINYDIINRNETARGRQGVSDINSNASFLGLDHGEREQMTDDEIAIFNYLYAQDTARGDAEHRTAYEYIDYLTKDLNYRRRQKEEAYWREYAKESPVGSSAFSILTSPMKGLSYIGQAADYLGTGKIDQNAGYNRLSYVNSAIRSQVSETIEQSGKWGKVGSFLYQTGMSMGDFLMNSLVTGAMAGEAVLGEKAFQIASNLSLAIMGTGAAADATIAAKDRGLTDKQAFTLGTIAGAAEVFTEKFSIEALLNGKWEDGALKYILKNAFTEGSEEVGSDFINLFADILVAKDKSEWRQTIDAYMAAGKTESEAFALAVAQQAAEMGLDFLGGALSGGTMASVGAGIGAVRNQAQYRQDGGQLRRLGDEMTRGILEEAEALYPNSEAYKLGQRLKKKQEKGKRLTDAEIGRLYAETTRALEQTEQAAPQPTQDRPQQILGVELPTAEQTGGVMLLPTAEQTEAQTQQRAAEQERQTAPQRETAETAQPGVLPTAEETDRRQRAASARTETERTGILLGVNDDTIARVLRISSAVGREAVFFDAAADAAGGIENGHFDPEDGRIYINAQSKNPVAQIISHELTHSIEGGGSYGDLQRLVLRRIQQDGGDLQTLRQQKAELYARHGKELKASEVDAEIVAEYVEKHLLTDEQSIREMVRQDRTLGQRILDFIDRLLAKLGSGSAQERAFLTKARSYYRSALQETQSSFTAEMRQQAETQAAGMEGMEPRLDRLRQQMASGEISDTEAEAVYEQTYNSEEDLRQGLGGLQHSIEELPDGKKYVRADRQVIFGNDPRSWSEQLEDYINGKIRRGGDVTLIGADGDALRLTATSAGKLSDYHTGDGRTMSSDAFERKVNAASHIDELAQTSVRGPKTVADYGSRHGAAASGGWNYRTAHFMDFDGKYYEVRISVALGADGKMIYNIGQMKEEAHPKIKGSRANNDDGPRGFASSDNSISNSGQDVNRKSEGRKYSYAGQNAKSANLQTLREAQEMQKAGADMESIRQATGWHLGMEGKWRFEIDDSGMQLRSDAADLSNYTTLGELVDAPELFEAYPQLKDVRLAFANLEDGERGHFSSEDNTIVLSEDLRSAPEDTLVHEIQHAIQDVEGFASGASPEYWARREYESGDLVTERLQREYDRTLNGLSRADQNQYIRYMELERELDRLFLSDENSEDGKRYAKLEAEQDALYEALYPNQWFRDLLDLSRRMTDAPAEYRRMYENTAGEIEARDAAARRRMTAEERRATMPKMADENTVFAEGTGWNRSFDYDPETASIKEQIEQSREELNKMEVVARETVPENLPNKDAAAKWAADRLKASGYKVDRQGFGEILFTKKDLDKGLRYADTPAEKAALAALPKVLKRGIEIGDHTNHKKREKQTVTFAAPVELNGVRGNMGVVINRNGNHYYAHRIVLPDGTVFQFSGINKDTTQELSRGVTVSGSLADTTSVASTDSVRDFDENVNTKYSLSEEEEDAGDDVPAALPTGQEESAKEESAKKQTEAEYQAERLGYPILNGVQVVPMRTYVHATDIIRDENNNIVYEKDGKPRRRDNYGMVVGRSPYDADELIVAFRNDEKHTRKDEVFISIDDLEVALPRGDSEGQRMAILMEQEPVQPDNENMSAEDRAELNEMLNRAQAKEMARRAPLEELEPVKREEVTGKARVKLEQAERALVRRVGRALSVPRFAQREYLQEIAQRISEEYLTTGRVSEKATTELFEQAYQKGIVVDTEFYQQYKSIKEHLRTQAVTISEEDKHDIADWGTFRKSAFGQLRIVNQGGTPVDIAYEELRSMAPALFPEDISHPADQLVRMFEVAQSIEKTEKSLNEYYGQDAAEFKRWAKNDFKEAVYDSIQALRMVKRYANDRMGKASTATEAPITPEQVAEAYKQLKKARWEAEKAKAKNLLTDHDKLQLGRLLRGEIELRHLDPDTDNVKGIRAVYEATAEYERLVKRLTDYKKRQRAALLEAADRYLETANDWKDKRTGLAYARETMERNFEDIVPDRKLAKEIVKEYITPVHDAEASATRFKTEYRDKVRALELSRKVAQGNEVSEAHAVQLLGEAMDNIRILENSRGRMAERDGKTLEDWRGVVQDLRRGNQSLDWAKINSAVERFRKIYDELFQRLNDVRVRNGYEPINYRSGYFPHFQPGDGGDGILSQFGRAMGIDTQVTALPTSINGLTHHFKPGITWFGNAQQRLGFNTAYDAVEGFDKYIEGAASVIFQTENIQRLRALATQMRYRTGNEGLRKQVDAVRADNRLTEEEKQSKINEIHKEGRFVLSNFVNELDEYTNLLANKKSRFDRGIEAALGRKVYSFLKNWESRVGANMIAGNLSSALTNFIPLTQARGQIGRASMLKGMWDTLKAYRNDDGFASRSSFLTNRRGSDPIVKSWSQKASGILGKPMEYIDTFTADSIVRARYDQNIRRGLSEAEAMSEADAFVGKVMADRSKGSMPTLFESKNPIFKAFTQFQLEVNNQFSEVFKDLPRAYRDKGLAALAAALFKYFIGAFLFNEVYEYIVGRRPALDPIGLLNDTAGDFTGYALPNLVELGVGAAQGELPSFQTEKASLGETGKNLAQNALGELPFSSGLALIGADVDGGRVPAASAVPDLTALWDAATKEGWSGKRRWKEVQDELSKLAYILPPFGGNQAQKIWKSVKALIEGGSYTVDADGSRKLQYPVFTDDPWETALNAGRMMLFGKSSLPTAQDWVEDNFNTLGANQTAAYQDMLEAGVRGEDAFALLQELRGAEKTDEQSRNAVQREILRQSDVPGEGKAITYYALLASDRERELMDALDGADPGAVTEMLLDIKDAGNLKGAAASGAKREAIARAPLTDEEKQTVYRYVMGTKQEDGSYTTSREDDIIAFRQAGLDFDTFLQAQSEYADINESYSGVGEKAMAFSRWVNSLDLTAEQAEIVRDCFRYFSQIPAEAARYDSFVSAGLDDDAAYALADSLNALEPEEGKKTVSNVQRYRAVIEAALSEDEQLAALQELMQESEYSKLQVGYDHGILPEAYVRFRELLPQYDADGNGTLNQKEVEKALDSMGGGVGLVLPGGSGGDQPLTVKQQAVLWQLANKSWKPNKNPYSASVGRKVYDALNAEPASGGILLPDGTGGLELPRG